MKKKVIKMSLKENLKRLYPNNQLSEMDLQTMELQTIQFLGILAKEYFEQQKQSKK